MNRFANFVFNNPVVFAAIFAVELVALSCLIGACVKYLFG